MDEPLKSFSSLHWWLSVVIAGILINLISSYLYKRLDSRFSSLSTRWREKSEAREAQRLKELDKLRKNPQEQIYLAFREMRHRIQSLMLVVLGLFFPVLAILAYTAIIGGTVMEASLAETVVLVLIQAVGALSIFFALGALQRASYERNLFEESQKEENPNEIR